MSTPVVAAPMPMAMSCSRVVVTNVAVVGEHVPVAGAQLGDVGVAGGVHDDVPAPGPAAVGCCSIE